MLNYENEFCIILYISLKTERIMIHNFFKWNEHNLSNEKPNPEKILTKGSRVNYPAMPKKIVMEYGGERYHVKIPHTRYFKNNRKLFTGITSLYDNTIATASELISEKKYKAFHFMTAGYDVTKRNEEFVLVSKRIDDDKIEMCSLYDMIKYPFDVDMRECAGQIAICTLSGLLEKKQTILGILTEDCFDDLIKFILLSVFEFSDDDHYNNILFVKDFKSTRFQSMFVCDKESTVFNGFLSLSGNYYGSLIPYTTSFNLYPGKIISKPLEDFKIRCKEIARLIRKGILPKKYIDFLKDMTNFDFDTAMRDVVGDFGVRILDKQLDMYKFGEEELAKILDKNL